MACAQTLNGIINDCAPSMGGIVEAYIANHADVASVSHQFLDSLGEGAYNVAQSSRCGKWDDLA